ncbi:MAG: molybdopterin-dependent oxidoreductase [Deltaproteobacteria bacterium]|nr:molybdopterin-dependent oxidoreductase [Deltaproteobacteria bacterium]
MGEEGVAVYKTVCQECYMGDGVLVHVKNGRITKIQGDPESPVTEGDHICSKCRNVVQGTLYHPDRLKYPFKRAGHRGVGKWESISWEQAIDEISDRILEVRRKWGPLSFAASVDGWHYTICCMFMRALGSPNLLKSMEHCEGPGRVMDLAVIGDICTQFGHGPDTRTSKCVLVWGQNPPETHLPQWRWIENARKEGAVLITVDPRGIPAAKKADVWLQVRPGSDAALGLGLIKVIVEEELYDKDFVGKWVHGFEALKERLKDYPLERIEELTWVKARDIRKVARLYASIKPASLVSGIGVMQGYGSTATAHTHAILVALTGNLDVQGGNLLSGERKPERFLSAYEFLKPTYPEHLLPEEVEKNRIGYKEFPLWSGPRAPIAACHNELTIRAMLSGEPYPVKALLNHGTNLLTQFPDPKTVQKALLGLELNVHFNYMMTPTAALSDYVLPAAHWLERDEIPLIAGLWQPSIEARVATVEPYGESRNEQQVILDLYWKCVEKGLEPLKSRTGADFVQWKTIDEFIDYCLKGMGVTWAELKAKHKVDFPTKPYRAYDREGFRFKTPTGKVEFLSTTLEQHGYDPLPTHREPVESPISTPELAVEYPLILMEARVRGGGFMHSSNRWAKWARRLHPYPQMDIHPDTAERLGLANDDWAWIENPRGRVLHRARVTRDIDPRVVSCEPGWWYPEAKGELFGAWHSNVSVLCSTDGPYDPVQGTPTLRSMLCKVYRAEEREIPEELKSPRPLL